MYNNNKNEQSVKTSTGTNILAFPTPTPEPSRWPADLPIYANWSVPVEAVIQKKAAEIMDGVTMIVMSHASEYAKSFGIDEGDVVFVDKKRKPHDGDLVLVMLSRNHHHDLDTYDNWAPSANILGVLVGCLKCYENPSDDD